MSSLFPAWLNVVRCGPFRSAGRQRFSGGDGANMRVHVLEPQLQYLKMASMSIALQPNPWVLGAWVKPDII